MRRLPIFFVLDVSESMIGENLKKLEDGLSNIMKNLRQDPHALETVFVSVIAFAGKVETIVPLIEISSFYPPKLPIGGGTSLGAALNHLMIEIDKSVVKTTTENKGDWKPIVYLLTDGKPTDNVNSALTKWKDNFANKVTLVAIALGRFADTSILKQLTEHAFVMDSSGQDEFIKFIKWVTASVVSQSKSVSDLSTENANLAYLDESILTLIKDIKQLSPADPNYVILTGRCQRNRLPYLMKYERNTQQLQHRDFDIEATHYEISGCFPVNEEYFEWSDGTGDDQLKVNTNELIGTPGCPHCGNSSAFGMCVCGKIMCLNGPGVAICPWCQQEVNFSPANVGEDGFDVNRARG